MEIRYTKRICSDSKKIEAFLADARVGVMGMDGAPGPYVVPVNFVWYNGCVYFHGMGSGKKEDILKREPSVCFTVFEEKGTVTAPFPCHADTSYFSVVIFGQAHKVTDFQEAAGALQKLAEKLMPGYYKHPMGGAQIEKYRSGMDGNAVSVYKVIPEHMTAKENAAEPDQLFRPGAE